MSAEARSGYKYILFCGSDVLFQREGVISGLKRRLNYFNTYMLFQNGSPAPNKLCPGFFFIHVSKIAVDFFNALNASRRQAKLSDQELVPYALTNIITHDANQSIYRLLPASEYPNGRLNNPTLK